jgi:hypothetical protein
VKLFRKTLCILYILSISLMLLSLLRVHQVHASAPPIDHNHQERYENPRNDTVGVPVCFNLSIDVWGYWQQVGQAYYRTNHSITFGQWDGDMNINDFHLYINNLTYYGLNLNGEIVYNYSIPQSGPPYTFENSTFYEEENVYSAFTYINASVFDTQGEGTGGWPYWYNFTLTAGVSRLNDIAMISVAAWPHEVYPGEKVSITTVVYNTGVGNETFDATTYGNDTVIGTQTVSDLPSGNWTTLTFDWNTTDVKPGNYKIKADASVVPGEWETADNTKFNGTVTVLTVTTWYMQNAKWGRDSPYWKLSFNNTLTSTRETICKLGWRTFCALGVKIYKGTENLTTRVEEVGRWYNLQSCLKNTTWNCDEHDVGGSYVKIEVYYRFAGDADWTDMNVAFKTRTFTEDTILTATTWTICLYGEYHMEWGPLGPPGQNRCSIEFYWGSEDEESKIIDMIFTQG